MKYCKNLMLICIVLFVMAAFAEAGIEVPSARYEFDVDGVKALLPYAASHDISKKNESIQRLMFCVHSASYDALLYLRNGLKMLEKKPQEKNKTLVIAPHLLSKKHVEELHASNILYWEWAPFWGTSRAVFNNQKIALSAYDVTDKILTDIISSGNFPNLKTIIVLGHSAGGQMVNRYAVSSSFENEIARPKGVELRYIVMAPSSYVYLNNERVVKGKVNEFSRPVDPPAGYDDWGYGCDSLYLYHRKRDIVMEDMFDEFSSRKVLYLVGSEDTDSKSSSLDKTPKAMLQGRNRLERCRIYYNYLQYYFGKQIRKTQHFRVIKGVGHSGRSLMLSPIAMRFVFSPKI